MSFLLLFYAYHLGKKTQKGNVMAVVTNEIKYQLQKNLCSGDTLTVFHAVLRFLAQYITAPMKSQFELKLFFLNSSNMCFTIVSDKIFLLLVTIIVHLFFHSFTV